MKLHMRCVSALVIMLYLLCTLLSVPAACAQPDTLHAHAAAQIPGIDVSKYQEEIDWDTVVKTDVRYAILRCCKVIRQYDDWELDPCFEENYEKARAAGMPIGCYIYTDAATEKEFIEDVDYMLGFLKGKSFELPVFLDMESSARQEHLSPDVFMPAVLAGLEHIEDAGHTAGVYSSSAFFYECINRTQLQEAGYPIWEANYFDTNTGLASPAGHDLSDEATIWQYSGCGKCDGIRTTVDRNICYTYQFFNHAAVITNSTLPSGDLKAGSNFTIGGNVSSENVLRTITGAIYDLNNNTDPIQTVTVYPHAKEYKLTGFFTKKLVFSTLPDGQYELRITAVDSSNTQIAVVNAPFSITEDGKVPEEPQEEPEPEETEEPEAVPVMQTETEPVPEEPAQTAPKETVRSEKSKVPFSVRFTIWYCDHWSLRKVCRKATKIGNRLALERTPLYRIVSRTSYRIETAYLTATIRLRHLLKEENA